MKAQITKASVLGTKACPNRKRAYRIDEFCAADGLGRTKVYELIKSGKLRTVLVRWPTAGPKGRRRCTAFEFGQAMKRLGPPKGSGSRSARKLRVAGELSHIRSDAGRASPTSHSSKSLSPPTAPGILLVDTALTVG